MLLVILLFLDLFVVTVTANSRPFTLQVTDHLLNKYWNTGTGHHEGLFCCPQGWWQTANTLETIGNVALSTEKSVLEAPFRKRIARVYNESFGTWTAYNLESDPPEDVSYDDIMWWGLAYLKAQEFCDKGFMSCEAPNGRGLSFLDSGISIGNFTWENSWNTTTCHGGYLWAHNKTYKNAITNSLGFALNSRIASMLREKKDSRETLYLDRAKTIYKWMHSKSGTFVNRTIGLLADGLDLKCNSKGKIWTYNQGVYLGGLVWYRELQKANDTIQGLINLEVKGIFNAILDWMTMSTDGSILVESSCFGNDAVPCNDDQKIFKGILARYLGYVYHANAASDPLSTQISKFLQSNQASLRANDTLNSTDSLDFGLVWEGPFDYTDALVEESALDLLWAAESTSKP